MCICTRKNRLSHILVTVWSMDNLRNRGSWWAQISRLCCPQSWAGTNNTPGLVVLVTVFAPGRARSHSSICEPLQNINSLPCRWRDNSPLTHHGGVTKREWISPSKPQRIEKDACTYTSIYRHEP